MPTDPLIIALLASVGAEPPRDPESAEVHLAGAASLDAVLAAARTIASLAVAIPGHGMCILPAHIEALRDALSAADREASR